MNQLYIYYVGSLPQEPSEHVFEVKCDSDYISIIRIIEDNLADKYGEIWLRESYHYKWIQTYVEHSGLKQENDILFEHVTARNLLSQRWGMDIPQWLPDDAIIEEDILNLPIPVGINDPAIALLHPILSPLIGQIPENFPVNQAGLLAEAFNNNELSAKLQKRVFASAWKSLCETWIESTHCKWVEEFLARLNKNPRKLWSDLTIWTLLQKYPEDLQGYALDPAAIRFLRQIPEESFENISLSDEGVNLAFEQIEYYIKNLTADNPSESTINSVLSQVSGKMIQEYKLVEKLFLSVPGSISRKNIDKVSAQFSRIEIKDRLTKLEAKIRPSRPRNPLDEEMDADGWIAWMTDEYMPYRAWQIQEDVFDQEVEDVVAAFSKWYVNDYSKIHANPALSAIQGIAQWKNDIMDDDFSLLLMVDNLPYFFLSSFNDAMRDAGFYLHEQKSRFVPLPSKTDVSKPMLLSGGQDYGSDYKSILKKHTKAEWHDRETIYFKDLDNFRRADFDKFPCIAFLNYLVADEWLHTDSAKSGIDERQQLSLFFSKLSEVIFEKCQMMADSGKTVGIYSLTDHGSSRLLDEERLAAESQLCKKLFKNEKCRSASMSMKEANEIPENVWCLGIRFEDSHNPDNVHLIPLGHNTVASSQSKGSYYHGGATPEEVIVPFSIYRLIKAERPLQGIRVIEPALQSGKYKWYIKRIEPITIEVQNRSSDDCVISNVEVHPKVADIRQFDEKTLSPGSSEKIQINLYFKESALQVTEITLTTFCRYGDESISSSLNLPVNITSAMSGGLNLKNL